MNRSLDTNKNSVHPGAGTKSRASMHPQRRILGRFYILLVCLVCAVGFAAGTASGNPREIRIGVLAHRGVEKTLETWGATAAYLQKKIPRHVFRIMPLGFDEIGMAVSDRRIDFVIANPSIYVELEARYGTTRIVTLKKPGEGRAGSEFGGVIFCRSDRADIRSLSDLKGKTFMAVDETSLGGWQMAWLELQRQGIDPYGDFRSLLFGTTHDAVVYAVRDGKVDAGTVRSETLEQLAENGSISMEEYRVLDRRDYEAYPYLTSTPLYPEWPFARLVHTDNDVVQDVTIELLSMRPDEEAARRAGIERWVPPLSYMPVHALLRELRIGQYRDYGKITLSAVLKKYRYELAATAVVIVLLTLFAGTVLSLNRRLTRSREGLERLRKQLDLILNSAGEGVFGLDVEGRVTFINTAGAGMLGYQPGELVGKDSHETWHHTDRDGRPRPRELCPIYAAYRDGKTHVEYDDIFWTGNGKRFPVEYVSTPMFEGGRVAGAVSVFKDISYRKEMDQRLREKTEEAERAYLDLQASQQKLQALFSQVEQAKKEWELSMDRTGNMIILMNAKQKIKRCNESFRRFLGLPYGQIIGQDWCTLAYASGFSIDMPLETRQGHIELHHKASNTWHLLEQYSYRDEKLSIEGHVVVIHDITEIKMVNEALQQAFDELKQAQSRITQQEKMASVGQLAAGVAHEINNPTGFIMSNLGSLQKYMDRLVEFIRIQAVALEGLPAETIEKIALQRKALKVDFITDDLKSLLSESLDGADRIKKIVQDLKSFSRVDEAEDKLADINAGIESTINIVRNELKYKASLMKEYGDIPQTKCNPGQLNQVFMNILLNAAHAIEKQGEIGIRTWADNGMINVSISDTGSGIPKDSLDRIFEPFFTTKEVGKGTGLGLSIAYDIMKKHKGTIEVESEVGKGTTFTVRIPVVEN